MYLSDMHTHSIASGHGTSCTISDMAKQAAARGIRLLGITDHGPATLAAGTPSYFRSLTFSPRKRFGIELLYGVELNILDAEGHLDLNDELLTKLDYAIASMHAANFRPGTCQENTDAFLNAMKHPCVKLWGTATIPSIPWITTGLRPPPAIWALLLKSTKPRWLPTATAATPEKQPAHSCGLPKYQVPVLLSSDSHGAAHIGDFTFAADFVHEARFPEALILNNQIPRLKAFLETRQLNLSQRRTL